MPMSNNSSNSSKATNGRNSAKTTIASGVGTTATTQKHEQKKPTSGPIKQGTNSSTDNSTTTTTSQNHRRENSSFTGGVVAGQIKRDPKLFHYGKPQQITPACEAYASSGTETNNDGDLHDPNVELDPTTLIYYDGKLIAGTLEALIQHMVPTSDYYPDRTYVFAFLLSARLFIRPHELLEKISGTWERQQQKFAAAESKDVVDDAHFSHLTVVSSVSPLAYRKQQELQQAAVASIDPSMICRTPMQKSAQNCIRLLAEWIETFAYDFRDERLMQQVRILARKCVFIDNSLGKQVSRILQLLVQRLTALEKYEEFLQTLANAETPGSTYNHAHSYSCTSAIASSGNATSHNVHNASSLNETVSTTTTLTSTSNSSSNNVCSSSNSDVTTPSDLFGIMDICGSCAQLAHQLTAIELERLSHIGPEEFVQAFVKDYQHTGKQIMTNSNTGSKPNVSVAASASSSIMTSSLHDMKKTRNLESYVEWFNRMSYLTASEIVKYPKKKQRVRIIEYWIETARECFNIGNFNSLMAIIAGLNLEPISRLKKTWSKVQSAKFSVLEHQMDPTSNFNSYRSTLKAAMWRSEGATDERERIIIPFFSLFVKDLYFLNEGCSNRLPNNHINFEKCSQLAKQIMEFNEWKKVKCPFEKLPNVIAYIQNSPVLNENTLSMASFECEPPENTEEKGRYKTVKAESKQQLLQQLQEQHQHQH